MFEVHQVKVHTWDPKMFTKMRERGYSYQPQLYPLPFVVVNILGSQKCALSLDVPQAWFNNWPDDDSLSRSMSPLKLTIN